MLTEESKRKFREFLSRMKARGASKEDFRAVRIRRIQEIVGSAPRLSKEDKELLMDFRLPDWLKGA